MNEYLQVAMPTNEQELRQLRKRYDTLKQTLGNNAASSDEFRQISMVFNMIRQRQQQQQRPQQQQQPNSRMYQAQGQPGQVPQGPQGPQVPPGPPGPQGPQQQASAGQGPGMPPYGFGGQLPYGAQQSPPPQQQQPGQQRPKQFPSQGAAAQVKQEDPLGWLNMNFQQDMGVGFDVMDSPHGQPNMDQQQQPVQQASLGGPPSQNQAQPGGGQQQQRWKEDDSFIDWLDPLAYDQEFQPRKGSVVQAPGQLPPQQQPPQQPPTPVQGSAVAQTPQPPTPVAPQGQVQQGQNQQPWSPQVQMPMFKSPAMGRAPTPVRVPATPKLGQQPLVSGFLTEEELNALKHQTAALQQAQKQKMLFLQKQRQQQIPSQQPTPQPQAQQLQQQQPPQNAAVAMQQLQQAQAAARQTGTPQPIPTTRAPSRQARGGAAAARRGSVMNMPKQAPLPPNIPQAPVPNSGGAHIQIPAPPVPKDTDMDAQQKKLKLQQWAAKQQQEDMLSKRYAEGAYQNQQQQFLRDQMQQQQKPKSPVQRPESPLGIVTTTADDKQVALKSKSKELKERFGFTSAVDPSSLIPKEISFEEFCRREELVSVSSLLPIGVSAQGMKRRRDWDISNDIATRRAELEKKNNRSIEEEIELKRLKLYKWCRAVRGDLNTTIQYFYSSSIDRSNRVHFARLRRLTLNEAALVEQIYKQQISLRNESKKQHSNDSQELQTVRETLGCFERKRAQRKLFHEHVLEYQNNAKREERKKLERSAKQRLQALRANDEEAYIKLLDQIKDTRITHLLKQTNLFLDSLAQAVRTQQYDTLRKNALENGQKFDENEVKQELNEEERDKIDYFEVAHHIKEPISEQPTMLVGGQLKEYQIKGLQWMVSLYNNNLNGILADEMGLGKTIQSIALICYLFEVKKVKGPFLVLVPLSTLTNWNMEFETWAPSLKRVVYKGPPAARKAQQAIVRSGDFQVLLTTYEYIIKDRPVLSRIKWAHMIIDEGHRMKNSNSKLSSTLTQHYSTRYRLILTGTPLQNNLPELWALLNFVLPKIFNSIKSFDEWFNKPFANAGSNDKIDLSEEETLLIIRRLHKVLRPFLLRRLKKDVEKYLPNKTEKVIKCKMSSLQSVMYQQLLRHNALFFANEKSLSNGVKGLNNRIIQLRKLCNHPFVFEEVENVINPSKVTNDLLWRVSGKFELLDRVLPKFKATGHRVLIFFQMTQIMDIMEDFLRFRGIQFLRLDGATRAEDRSELLRLFNDPESPYFCFLLSTRAGGLGLNLQTADTVIIYDTDWNPHQDLQAQDRAHRIGQTKEVRILRLITENSIEENILERAQGKLKIDGKVIQAGKFDNKSTSEEQEAFLRTLLEAEDNNKDHEEEELENDMDDDELNGMLARNEEERKLFAEIDQEREIKSADSKPRLFTEEELPEVCTDAYLQRQIEAEQAAAYNELVSRRDRNRKQNINYNDEHRPPEGPKKKMKLVQPTKQRRQDEYHAEDDPMTPDGVQPVGRVRRQGRPPKVKETLSPDERDRITKNMLLITERIKKAVTPDGRPRIELFREFPSKRLYPDYYQVIANPIAVSAIEKRIQGKVYQQIDQFAFDWRLMFANARRYNEEGSFVYDDANALEEIFINSFRELYDHDPPQHPQAPQPLRRARPLVGGAGVGAAGPDLLQSRPIPMANSLPNTSAVPYYSPNVPPRSLSHTPAEARVPQQVPSQIAQVSHLAQEIAQGSHPQMSSQQQHQPQVPQQMPQTLPIKPTPVQQPPQQQQQQLPKPPVPQQQQQAASHDPSSVMPNMAIPQPPPPNATGGEVKDEMLDLGMDDAVLGEMLNMGNDMDIGGMQGFDVDSYLNGNGSLDNLSSFQ